MDRIVTVDGPAGSGKTTLGSRLARELGLRFVDTGLFYRAVLIAALRARADSDSDERLAAIARATRIQVETDPDATAVAPLVLVDGEPAGPELHDPRHAGLLARLSGVAGVRAALLPAQRSAADGGAVAAGRDCGTVVFPDAPVKIYLRASVAVREARRAAQLHAEGARVDAATLDSEVALRDRADTTRAAAPLQPAKDAHIIDNDNVNIDELVHEALVLCGAAGLVAP